MSSENGAKAKKLPKGKGKSALKSNNTGSDGGNVSGGVASQSAGVDVQAKAKRVKDQLEVGAQNAKNHLASAFEQGQYGTDVNRAQLKMGAEGAKNQLASAYEQMPAEVQDHIAAGKAEALKLAEAIGAKGPQDIGMFADTARAHGDALFGAGKQKAQAALKAKDLQVDIELFTVGANAPQELERREASKAAKAQQLKDQNEAFNRQLSKANEQMHDVMDKLQPVMEKALAAREKLKERMETIKTEVRELVLEHVMGTVSDVKSIYDGTGVQAGLVSCPFGELAPDPTTVLPSVFAPLYLRAMINIYKWRFFFYFVTYIAITIALVRDRDKSCSPKQPGGLMEPRLWLTVEVFVLLIQTLCNMLFFCRIRRWIKRADAPQVDEKDGDDSSTTSLLQPNPAKAFADKAQANLRKRKEKYDANQEALVLMDRLNACPLSTFMDLYVVFTLVWEGMGVYISIKADCAHCDNIHVVRTINFISLVFLINLAPLLLQFLLFCLGFVLRSRLVKRILKVQAAKIDDTIGVPLCSLTLQIFVLRKRTTAREAAAQQLERDLFDLEKEKRKLDKRVSENKSKIDKIKARRRLVRSDSSIHKE